METPSPSGILLGMRKTTTTRTTTPCGRYEETHHASERHVMYRCATCASASRVTMTYSYMTSQRVVGRYSPPHASGHQYRMPAGAIHRGTEAPAIACSECGDYMTGQPIRGTTNPAVRCGSKCRNAKGGECECACGGEHHGAGYSA